MLSKKQILNLNVGDKLLQHWNEDNEEYVRSVIVCEDDDGNGPRDSEGFLFMNEEFCDEDEIIVIDMLDMNDDGIVNDVWGTSWFELNN